MSYQFDKSSTELSTIQIGIKGSRRKKDPQKNTKIIGVVQAIFLPTFDIKEVTA